MKRVSSQPAAPSAAATMANRHPICLADDAMVGCSAFLDRFAFTG
jgi:hypothetical protein